MGPSPVIRSGELIGVAGFVPIEYIVKEIRVEHCRFPAAIAAHIDPNRPGCGCVLRNCERLQVAFRYRTNNPKGVQLIPVNENTRAVYSKFAIRGVTKAFVGQQVIPEYSLQVHPSW